MADTSRLRRLRLARITGHVPRDLMPWLVELAIASGEANGPECRLSPIERLTEALGDEIDRWMVLRGVNQSTIDVPRRTVGRALRGENLTLETVSEIADALGCVVEIRFLDRGASDADPGTSDPAAAPSPTLTDDAAWPRNGDDKQ